METTVASIGVVVGAVAKEAEFIDRVKGLVEDNVIETKVNIDHSESKGDAKLVEVGRVSSGTHWNFGNQELIEINIIHRSETFGESNGAINVNLGNSNGGDKAGG